MYYCFLLVSITKYFYIQKCKPPWDEDELKDEVPLNSLKQL